VHSATLGPGRCRETDHEDRDNEIGDDCGPAPGAREDFLYVQLQGRAGRAGTEQLTFDLKVPLRRQAPAAALRR
jgi:hypothetical protein